MSRGKSFLSYAPMSSIKRFMSVVVVIRRVPAPNHVNKKIGAVVNNTTAPLEICLDLP